MTDRREPPAPFDAADALDRQRLRAAAAGDRTAFDALYRDHHRRLCRFLHRQTHRRDLVDDVYNDAMWVVWRKAGEFRGESRVSTWITGIAYRCMLAALRGANRGPELDETALDGVEREAVVEEDDIEGRRELRDWLSRGMRTLPPDQRVTLEMAYFLGHTCEEIAVVMNCAVGTVKARMFHARVRLRNVMPALGGAVPPGRDAALG